MSRVKIWLFVGCLILVTGWNLALASESTEILRHLDAAAALQYDNTNAALTHALQAKELAHGDEYWSGKAANRLGAVYYVAGEYNLALENFAKALEIFSNSTKGEDYVMALNGLGLIYLGQKEYKEASKVWRQSLELNLASNDSVALSRNYLNLGIASSFMAEYQEALDYFDAAISFISNSKHNYYVMSKNRLAHTYYELKDYQQAKNHYGDLLQKPEELNNWEKAFAYTGLAEVLLAEGETVEALEMGRLGYEYSQSVGANWDMERATEVLANIYEQMGDMSNALAFTKLHRSFTEKLFNEEKERQIAGLHLKLSQAENESLKAEKAKSDQGIILRNFILSLMVIVLGGFVFNAFIYRKSILEKEKYNNQLTQQKEAIERQKEKISNQNLVLNQLNEAKNRVFSVLTHDLKSPINSIRQLLELQKEGMFTQEEKEEALELLYDQIVKTDYMMNQLLKWANQQIEGISVKTERLNLPEEVEEVIEAYRFQASAKRIRVIHQPAKGDTAISFDKGHLKIILQNLLNNGIKFTPAEGEISFSYSNDGESLQLHIKDTGVGMKQEQLDFLSGKNLQLMESGLGTEKEKGTGLGLLVVKQFMSNNEGLIKVSSKVGEGTEFILSFSPTAVVAVAEV